MQHRTCIPTSRILLQSALAFLLLVGCGHSGEDGSGESPSARGSGPNQAATGAGQLQDTMLTLVDDSATAGLNNREWSPPGEADLRGRPVVINPVLMQTPDTLTEGRSLLLNLFDDRRPEGVLTRTGRNFANVVSVSGRIPAEEGAWFTMSVDDSQILAHIYFVQPDRYFTVYYSDELQQHVVVERDPAQETALPEHPPVVPPDTSDNLQSP